MRSSAALLALTMLIGSLSIALADAPHFDPDTMMRTSELRRGMTGYGLTVFEGVEIERFDVEILGVLSKARRGEDLVLVRVVSGPVVERQSGIIAGMSGSPVYVNGRLIGAIAYGWGFLREAIGGVTPIESMLKIYGDSGGGHAELPRSHPARGAELAGRWVEEARLAPDGPAFEDSRTINMRPVGPVISVAGMGANGMQRLDELFAPHGLETMVGPGSLTQAVPVELAPGAAVGVKLIDGDFDATGVGTLTWRDGERILAFGHPMMEIGAVEWPLTTAWIHDFLPSAQRSMKMSSPMEVVGSMVRDGSWAVAGEIGASAPMLPANFTVTDEDRGVTRSFEVSVADHEELTAGLMLSAMVSSIEATYNIGGKGVASIDFELTGTEGAVIRRSDRVYHPGFIRPVVSWVGEALYFLTENRFEPQQPASLRATVSMSDDERLAAVERIYTDETVARAGEELTVRVVMRPHRGERFEQVVRFDLPEDLPKGTIRIGAAAGDSEYAIRSALRLLMPQIDSLQDIATIIETMKRADQLYVAVAVPRVSVGLEGQQLPMIPTSMLRVFSADEQSALTAGHTELSETLASDYTLYGAQVLRLPTEDRKGERGTVRPLPETDRASDAASTSSITELDHMWWAASAIEGGGFRLQDADLPDGTLPPEPSEEPVLDDPASTTDEKETEETATDDDATDHPEPDGDALARGLSHKVHTTAAEFEKGTTDGTMVRSDGAVVLAPRAELVAQVSEAGIWSIAAQNDTVWFGTANPGRVYRWREGAEAELLSETGSMMVLSILPRDDGGVLVGTAPDGRVLQIAADGTVTRSQELGVNYVWCLQEHAGEVIAGTGPRGEIYRLDDRPTLLARVTQRHVQDLLSTGERLFAAAGDDQATVVEILPGGSVRGFFGSGESSCTALALDGRGRIIVATAESGKIYAVSPDGRHEETYDSDGNVMALASNGDRVWAATTDEGKLVVLDDRDRSAIAYRETKTDQIIAVAAGGGAVFAATANPGRVWRLATEGLSEGTYISEEIDAERVARWARMDWDATVPAGSALQIDARSGESSIHTEASWGYWTDLLATPGATILAPAARYLQYRLRLSGSISQGPELRRAEVLYQPQNRKPTLEVSEPKPGRAIRNRFEIEWTAKDPDSDTLLIGLYYRKSGAEKWTEIETLVGESKHNWNTKPIPSGIYDLRVVVSDEPSNPIDARQEEVIVERVTVDNSNPKLVVLSKPRRGDDDLTLRGLATDDFSRIISIDWTFGSKELWRAAVPDDGLFDSQRELFSVRLPEIPDSELSLQIRVRDAAGNVTVETVPLLDRHPADGSPPDAEEDAAPAAGGKGSAPADLKEAPAEG